MTRRTLLLCSFLAALYLIPAFAAGQGPAPDARPRFDGIWNSATATPLERPAQLKDKAFFTPEEAAEWERQVTQRNQEPATGTVSKSVGTYNTFFREFGSSTVKTLRTSIITEPADGRIPALTPEAAEVKRRRVEAMKDSRKRPGYRSTGSAVWRSSPPAHRCFRILTTATTTSCRPGTHSLCMRR